MRTPVNKEVIGGKALGIIHMLNVNNLNIPKGFVLSSHVFWGFLNKSKLKGPFEVALHDKDIKKIRVLRTQFKDYCYEKKQIEKLKAIIVPWLQKYNFSTVAVRSSYTSEDGNTNAFPGVFSTSLNIATSHVSYEIISCWLSLFSDKAISYFLNSGTEIPLLGMAVIIQEMIKGEFSGVAFTKNPITHNTNEIYIEFHQGDCSVIVEGLVTPKIATFTKPIMENNFNLFKERFFLHLCLFLVHLEKQINSYADVEWTALSNGEIFILQCRPITTNGADIYHFSSRNSISLWLNDSIATHTLSHISMESSDYSDNIDTIDYVKNGYFERYKSTEDIARRTALGYKLLNPHFFNVIKYKIEKIYNDTLLFFNLLYKKDYTLMCSSEMVGLLRTMGELNNRSYRLFEMSSAQSMGVFDTILTLWVDDPIDREKISSYLEIDMMDEEKVALYELSLRNWGDIDILNHIRAFPWISTNCYDCKQAIDLTKHRLLNSTQACSISELAVKKIELQAEQKRLFRKYMFNHDMINMINMMHYIGHSRLKTKLTYAGMDFFTQGLFSKIEKDFNVSAKDLHDYYFLYEIIDLVQNRYYLSTEEKLKRDNPFLFIIKHNKLQLEYSTLKIKRFIDKNMLPFESEQDQPLYGKSACSGYFVGQAVVLRANDYSSFQQLLKKISKNEILICDMLQPNMSILISKVGGLITDEGGVLSHAAILAREYNIPCLVGTKLATKKIKTGDQVILNSTQNFCLLV